MDFKTKIAIISLILISILPWFIIKILFKILLFVILIVSGIIVVGIFIDMISKNNKSTKKHNLNITKQMLQDYFNQQSQKNHSKEHTQEQPKEHKKDEFESKQQTETSAQYKGRLYEYKIKCYLENQGFKVYPNGYINGKKDKGIDLIAYKDNDIHLIQCKCYRYPPKQDLIRKFYGDCKFYEDKNPNLVKNKTMVYRFITSCKDMDYSTQKYLEENTFIRYEIINI